MTIEELSVQFEVEFSQVKTAVDSIKSQFDNLENNVSSSTSKASKGISGIGSTVKAIVTSQIVISLAKQLTQLAVNGVKSAMSVESSLNNLNRTLGTSASHFVSWAEEVGSAYGMATEDALNYGSTYANLISGFTSGTKETTALTIDLMETASVVASATGRSFSDTAERIRSGLLGDTESIEDLGIYANVAMVKTSNAFKELANGSSWESLSYNTQQQIRLMSILEQATEKYGNTIASTTASRHNTFTSSLKNVQTALGQAFLPIYNVVLPALTAIAQAIGTVLNYVAKFMSALFGVESSVASSLGSATTSSGLSGVAETVEEDLEGANTEAKKLKGQLMGFDEVNTLNLETDTSGSGSVDTGTLDTTTADGSIIDFSETETVFDSIASKMEELAGKVREWWGSIDFEPITNSLSKFTGALDPFVDIVKEAIVFVITKFLAPLSKWVIEDGLPIFFDTLRGILEVLSPVLEGVWEGFSLVWGIILDIGGYIGGSLFTPILEIIVGLFTSLTGSLRDSSGELTWFGTLMEGIGVVLGIVAGGITAVYVAIGIYNGVMTVCNVVTGTFSGIMAVLTSNTTLVIITIGLVVGALILLYQNWDAVWNGCKDLTKTVCEWIVEKWEAMCEAIQRGWEAVKDFFSTIWDTIKDSFKVSFEFITDGFSSLWEGIKNVWSVVVDFFSTIWDGIKTGAGNLWESCKEFWTNAKDNLVVVWENTSEWFANIWNSIKTGASDMWDNIKDWTNSARESFNEAWDNVVDWISQKWDGLKERFSAGLDAVVSWASSTWTIFKDGWSNTFSAVGDFFSSVWQGISSTFSTVVNGMWDMFTGTFSDLYNWLKSKVLDPITNGFNTFMNGCKSIVNTVIGWVNKLINGINRISVDVPDWLGGGSIGFSIPTVPYLAKGGIINQPTLAMVGEAGTEAVVPLEDTSFVTTIASAIGSAVLGAMNVSNISNNSSSDKEVVIQIDGTQLARVMNSYNQRENRRVGSKLVTNR